MKKFVDLMVSLFMAVGAILFYMTPFSFIKYYTANETIDSCIESIMLAIVAMILWPMQVIIGTMGLLLLVICSVVVMVSPGPTDKLQQYYVRIVNANINFYKKG